MDVSILLFHNLNFSRLYNLCWSNFKKGSWGNYFPRASHQKNTVCYDNKLNL